MLLPILFFIGSSSILFYSYDILIHHLDDNTPNFSSLDDIKKHYVVKNLIKTVYLCILVIMGFPLLVLSFSNYFPNTMIKIIASLYCSNDIVGLFKVKKLPTSTRLHHITTVVFLLMALVTDFQTNRVAQMLFYYTYFSAMAFPVNAYLGLRYCFDESDIIDIKHIAKHIYPLTCCLNWIVQFYMIGSTYYDVAYTFLIIFIVYDDIILLRWLWKENAEI